MTDLASEKGLEGRLFYLRRLRSGLFSSVHAAKSSSNFFPTLSIFAMILDSIQMASFPLAQSFGWSISISRLQSISSALTFRSIAFEETAQRISFNITLVVLLSLLNLFYIGYKTSKNQSPASILVNFLRFSISLFTSLGFIPILFILIAKHANQAIVGFSLIFTGYLAPTIHLFLTFSFSMISFIPYATVKAPKMTDRQRILSSSSMDSSNSTLPHPCFTARPHSRWHFSYLFLKAILVILQYTFFHSDASETILASPTSPILLYYSIGLTVSALSLSLSFVIYLPLYRFKALILKAACLAPFTALSILALLSQLHIIDLSTISGAVVFLSIFLTATLNVIAVFISWKLVQSMAARFKSTSILPFILTPFHAELIIRSLLMNSPQTTTEKQIKSLYDQAIEDFPSSSFLRLHRLLALHEINASSKSIQLLLDELQLHSNSLFFDVKFLVYSIAADLARANSATTKSDLASRDSIESSFIAQLEFRRSITIARSSQARTLKQIRTFWQHILQQEVSYTTCLKLSKSINASLDRLGAVHKILMNKYPSSPTVYRGYADFLAHLKSQPFRAGQFYDLASQKTIELAESRRQAGAGINRPIIDELTAFIAINLNSTVQHISDSALSLFDHQRDEVLGLDPASLFLRDRTLSDLIDPKKRDFDHDPSSATSTTSIPVIGINRTGSLFPARLSLARVRFRRETLLLVMIHTNTNNTSSHQFGPELYVNPHTNKLLGCTYAAEATLGYSSTELSGMSISAMMPELMNSTSSQTDKPEVREPASLANTNGHDTVTGVSAGSSRRASTMKRVEWWASASSEFDTNILSREFGSIPAQGKIIRHSQSVIALSFSAQHHPKKTDDDPKPETMHDSQLESTHQPADDLTSQNKSMSGTSSSTDKRSSRSKAHGWSTVSSSTVSSGLSNDLDDPNSEHQWLMITQKMRKTSSETAGLSMLRQLVWLITSLLLALLGFSLLLCIFGLRQVAPSVDVFALAGGRRHAVGDLAVGTHHAYINYIDPPLAVLSYSGNITRPLDEMEEHLLFSSGALDKQQNALLETETVHSAFNFPEVELRRTRQSLTNSSLFETELETMSLWNALILFKATGVELSQNLLTGYSPRLYERYRFVFDNLIETRVVNLALDKQISAMQVLIERPFSRIGSFNFVGVFLAVISCYALSWCVLRPVVNMVSYEKTQAMSMFLALNEVKVLQLATGYDLQYITGDHDLVATKPAHDMDGETTNHDHDHDHDDDDDVDVEHDLGSLEALNTGVRNVLMRYKDKNKADSSSKTDNRSREIIQLDESTNWAHCRYTVLAIVIAFLFINLFMPAYAALDNTDIYLTGINLSTQRDAIVHDYEVRAEEMLAVAGAGQSRALYLESVYAFRDIHLKLVFGDEDYTPIDYPPLFNIMFEPICSAGIQDFECTAEEIADPNFNTNLHSYIMNLIEDLETMGNSQPLDLDNPIWVKLQDTLSDGMFIHKGLLTATSLYSQALIEIIASIQSSQVFLGTIIAVCLFASLFAGYLPMVRHLVEEKGSIAVMIALIPASVADQALRKKVLISSSASDSVMNSRIGSTTRTYADYCLVYLTKLKTALAHSDLRRVQENQEHRARSASFKMRRKEVLNNNSTSSSSSQPTITSPSLRQRKGQGKQGQKIERSSTTDPTTNVATEQAENFTESENVIVRWFMDLTLPARFHDLHPFTLILIIWLAFLICWLPLLLWTGPNLAERYDLSDLSLRTKLITSGLSGLLSGLSPITPFSIAGNWIFDGYQNYGVDDLSAALVVDSSSWYGLCACVPSAIYFYLSGTPVDIRTVRSSTFTIILGIFLSASMPAPMYSVSSTIAIALAPGPYIASILLAHRNKKRGITSGTIGYGLGVNFFVQPFDRVTTFDVGTICLLTSILQTRSGFISKELICGILILYFHLDPHTAISTSSVIAGVWALAFHLHLLLFAQVEVPSEYFDPIISAGPIVAFFSLLSCWILSKTSSKALIFAIALPLMLQFALHAHFVNIVRMNTFIFVAVIGTTTAIFSLIGIGSTLRVFSHK